MNDTITMEITGLAFGGEGIARNEGKVCFIPYTCPGDIAEVRITESKKKFDRGEMLRLIEAGEGRREPQCPYFGLCGGCSLQHIDYPVQLEAKRSHLEHLLQRRAGVEATVPEVVPSPSLYHWRRNARMRVVPPAELGFRKAGSREVVPIDSCPVLEEDLNEEMERVRRELSRFEGPLPSEVELSRPPGEPVGHSFIYRKGKKKNRGHRAETRGFIQANEGIDGLLKKDIHDMVSSFEEKPLILDLFCGDGNLSLHLSDIDLRVEGYDISPVSIARAEWLRTDLGLEEFTYKKEKFPEILKKLESRRGEFSLAILDPPRGGLLGETSTLAELEIPTLLYVSCIPSILARDLEELVHRGGYTLRDLRLYDMFPHTSHVETLALLEKTPEPRQ